MKVRCIDNAAAEEALVRGKVYEVELGTFGRDSYFRINGEYWARNRFVELPAADTVAPAPFGTTTGITILDLVKADLDARDAVGRKTYGSSLTTRSDNDALEFAYDEALDLCMYLRQEIERRKEARESTAVCTGSLTHDEFTYCPTHDGVRR